MRNDKHRLTRLAEGVHLLNALALKVCIPNREDFINE